jgi:hypothetical protein
MDNNKEDNKKTSYNLSEWKINIIGAQLNKATETYQSGKLISCFFVWKSIKKLFESRLNADEKKNLNNLEVLAFKNKRNKGKFSYYLDKYTLSVNEYMNKYGLDFSDKEEWTGL